MSGLSWGFGALGSHVSALYTKAASKAKAAASWERQGKNYPAGSPERKRAVAEAVALLAEARELRAKAAAEDEKMAAKKAAARKVAADKKLSIPSLTITREYAEEARPVPVTAPTEAAPTYTYKAGSVLTSIAPFLRPRTPMAPLQLPYGPRMPLVQAPLASAVSPWVMGAGALLAFGALAYWATR